MKDSEAVGLYDSGKIQPGKAGRCTSRGTRCPGVLGSFSVDGDATLQVGYGQMEEASQDSMNEPHEEATSPRKLLHRFQSPTPLSITALKTAPEQTSSGTTVQAQKVQTMAFNKQRVLKVCTVH